MRFLYRFGYEIAAGHGEVLAEVTRIRVHHQHVGGFGGGLQPHGMPLLRVDAEAAHLGGRRALARTPLDTAARDQVERCDAFRHPSRMVVRGGISTMP